MKKILIVDDEPNILMLLSYNLTKEGYIVDEATDGLEGYKKAKENSYDFLILDLMLPHMDGIEICKKLRSDGIETPILILTAKDSEVDKIIGLELGADDYMTKPFSPREVSARIKAIFRRVNKNNVKKYNNNLTNNELQKFGNIFIDEERNEVYFQRNLVELTRKQYDLLLYMVRNKGKTLSREKLLDRVWGIEFSVETRIVDVHIGNLREKFEPDTKNPVYFKTVRGFGYRFEVPNDEK